MALYDLEHYLYRLKLDPVMQADFMARAHEHLAAQPLSDEERGVLERHELERLWLLGVHPMLMAPLGRLFGLSPTQYRDRLRPLAGQRQLRSGA
ncbi:MAG: hypothetical protein Q7T63_16185 [Burkholderiaceae bacterium]|nr:hypothetical protein [Burkholderiaceae bacterium]